MTKYKILITIYLFSVIASSMANSFGIDVQSLYRLPFLNIRWIDIAILIIIVGYFYSLIHNFNLIKTNGLVISLCFLYLLFEAFQLVKSWGATDISYQIAGMLCTLGFFILIDLSTFAKASDEILGVLKKISLWGAIVTIIINLYLGYSFILGNIILTDLDTRVAISVSGAREIVSISVLIPFVYAFSLFFIKNERKLWKKLIYVGSVLCIYVSLVISFHRGNLITVALITIIYLAIFSKNFVQLFSRILGVVSLLVICYLLFGNILRQKGYDPLEKLTETAEFAIDVDNPDWDKGRSLAREYELNVWEKHPWTGVGYDDPHNNGLPDNIASAHNFIVTSLFHNGIIGTVIYLLILLILYLNSIRLWSILGKEDSYQNNMLKLLTVVSFFWLIPFWTQEVLWEKYSLSIQFVYLGILTNMYSQKVLPKRNIFSLGSLKQNAMDKNY